MQQKPDSFLLPISLNSLSPSESNLGCLQSCHKYQHYLLLLLLLQLHLLLLVHNLALVSHYLQSLVPQHLRLLFQILLVSVLPTQLSTLR